MNGYRERLEIEFRKGHNNEEKKTNRSAVRADRGHQVTPSDFAYTYDLNVYHIHHFRNALAVAGRARATAFLINWLHSTLCTVEHNKRCLSTI